MMLQLLKYLKCNKFARKSVVRQLIEIDYINDPLIEHKISENIHLKVLENL